MKAFIKLFEALKRSAKIKIFTVLPRSYNFLSNPHRPPLSPGHVSGGNFFGSFSGEGGGDKEGENSMFCGSSVGGTCRGWPIFS